MAEDPKKRLSRAEKRVQTRQRLLDAAAETFARKGFASASLDEIAEAAGFSIGAVYSNFASKDDLFAQLMADGSTQLIDRVAQTIDAARTEHAHPFRALGQILIDIADKDIEAAELETEFWLHAVRNPDAMQIFAERSEQTWRSLRAVVADELARNGVDDSVDREAFATLASAMFDGLVRERRTDPSRVSEDLFGQALGWLIAGLPKTTR